MKKTQDNVDGGEGKHGDVEGGVRDIESKEGDGYVGDACKGDDDRCSRDVENSGKVYNEDGEITEKACGNANASAGAGCDAGPGSDAGDGAGAGAGDGADAVAGAKGAENVCFDGHKVLVFNLGASFICKARQKEILEILPRVDILFGNVAEFQALFLDVGMEGIAKQKVSKWYLIDNNNDKITTIKRHK